jgi:hypothetical protein
MGLRGPTRRVWPATVALPAVLLAASGCASASPPSHPQDVTRAFKDYAGPNFTLPWLDSVSTATIQPTGSLEVRTSLGEDQHGHDVGTLVWGYGNLFAHEQDSGQITTVRVLAGDGGVLEQAHTRRPRGG